MFFPLHHYLHTIGNMQMFKDSKLKKALILSTLGAKGSHFYLRKNIGKIPYMLAFCTQQLAQFMDPDRFFCLDPEQQKKRMRIRNIDLYRRI
jgi:hypothetical protein